MKFWTILTFISGALIACGGSDRDSFMLPPPDSNEKEKITDPNGEWEKINLNATSPNGHISISQKPDTLIVAGDRGVWVDGEKHGNLEVTSVGSSIAADINNNRSWIAVGDQGIFIDGFRVSSVEVGSSDSKFAVGINDKAQWIAVGNKKAYVGQNLNYKELVNIEAVRGNGNVKAIIHESGEWLIVSDRGAWRGQNSFAGSSKQ